MTKQEIMIDYADFLATVLEGKFHSSASRG